MLLCALGGVFITVLPATTASAAPIDDLRAEAIRIEGEMNTIATQLGALYEQTKSTQYVIDQSKQEIAESQDGIAAAQGEVTRTTALVRERAASVYRKAGVQGVGEFDVKVRAIASRRKYADATTQKDAQLLHQLDRAKEGLAARQASAEKVKDEVQRKQDVLKGQQVEFEAHQAELTKLKSSVSGEIAELVAQAEAARRAADAARTAATVVNKPGVSRPAFDTSNIPPASGNAGAVVAYAMAQLGKDYCYAGVGPDCFDCSGLTQSAWALASVYMPHNSEAQVAMFPQVPFSEAKPGDLAWFPGHIGVYVGGGAVVNSTTTGDFVRIHPLSLYSKIVRPG